MCKLIFLISDFTPDPINRSEYRNLSANGRQCQMAIEHNQQWQHIRYAIQLLIQACDWNQRKWKWYLMAIIIAFSKPLMDFMLPQENKKAGSLIQEHGTLVQNQIRCENWSKRPAEISVVATAPPF